MKLKTIKDIDIAGKTVIHHCDFNIKLVKNTEGELVPISDVRIKAYFPTIFYLLNRGCKIVFISYLERPGGKRVPELSTAPVAKRLSQLINREVKHLPWLTGKKVRAHIVQMEPGEMVLLENTRFYPGEESDNDELAREIARNGEILVQDAFGHCHRVHASVTGIPRHIESVAGLYLMGEMEIFDKLKKNPDKPLTLIVGGTKTHDKVGAVRKLVNKSDHVLLGGAVANVFLRASGVDVQKSFMQEYYVDKAKGEKVSLEDEANELIKQYSDKIVLPVDLVVADKIVNSKRKKIIDLEKGEKLPKDWAILDIGPKTIRKYCRVITKSGMIFWDGPMGKYENPKYRDGTLKIAEAIASSKGKSILAGGDTAALAEDFGLIFRYDHVSIAGGATLEYLADMVMPGIEVLQS